MRPNFAATLANLLIEYQLNKDKTAALGETLQETPSTAADQASTKPARLFDSKTPGRVESSQA